MSLRIWMLAPICLSTPLISTQALAADNTPTPVWTSSAELGAAVATGNSQSTNVNAKLKIKYHDEPWTNKLRLETLRASENGNATANRVLGSFESNYSLDKRNYVFGATRAIRDTFSGYDYQVNAATGLGHRFWMSDAGSFTLEVGPGFRRAKLNTGETSNDLIGRVNGDLEYRFSQMGKFEQELTVLAGHNNTEIESVSSLSASMTKKLAMKLSYTVQHNTQVPANTRHTDTFTSVNLVYQFE